MSCVLFSRLELDILVTQSPKYIWLLKCAYGEKGSCFLKRTKKNFLFQGLEKGMSYRRGSHSHNPITSIILMSTVTYPSCINLSKTLIGTKIFYNLLVKLNIFRYRQSGGF